MNRARFLKKNVLLKEQVDEVDCEIKNKKEGVEGEEKERKKEKKMTK